MAEIIQERARAQLLERRCIYVSREITGESAEILCASLVLLDGENKNPITIYIDSFGGNSTATLDIYDVLKSVKSPTVGIVVRRASSGAAILLQACRTRKTYLHGQILLHFPFVERSLFDLMDEKRRKKILLKANSQLEFCIRVLAKRTGKSYAKAKRLFGNSADGRTFTSTEALAEGLVDEII